MAHAGDSVQAARASVLIVDDTPANLFALAAVLKPLGARVVEATSGAEALSLVERENFAVVLLDVQMPDLDGFQVASRMRATERGKELPIIFLTAIHRDDRFAKQGYATGAADYITKPFDADILRARVKAFVDLFEQREQVRKAQVAERTRERDEALRRLVAFERIASAAVDSSDLAVFLKELLGVFLGAADEADSAAILLRDGDRLRVQACVGVNEEVDERFSVAVGQGFQGRIAESRLPLAIANAATSPLVTSEWLRARGTKALFGVPLTHDDEVLGVAQIGSTRAAEFSESERRLFAAMAERASWAVAKQIKRTKLHDVLAVAPAMISIVRVPSFEYEFTNAAYRDLFGGGELVGSRFLDHGLGEAALTMLRKAYVMGETISVDELRTSAGGGERFLRFTAQPIRNHAGSVDSVLTFAVDVTAQVVARGELLAHQAERAVLLERERAARAEAELASRAKDDFLATVSHELRTPLNAILGWAVLARSKSPSEVDNALAIIERNAKTQSRIIEDVLDISRVVSGKLRLEVGSIVVSSVVHGAVESLRPAAEAKGVTVHAEVGEVEPLTGDPERIQQVIWNLVSNGIKFTPRGGRVDVRAKTDGPYVVVEVADTGEGIAGSFLPHVFDAFRQADSSSARRHGGLGLGLAIVKQLVMAHGGRVSVTSAGVGLGTTFRIELPFRANLPAAAHDAAHDASVDTGAPRLDGLRVLVVDDDDDARALLEEILSGRGAAVTTASSAREGLDAFQRFRPDVLVSDIAMPGGDGYGLIRAIRALPSERGGRTPGIAVTAHARTEDGERAFAAGFQSHLPKPLDVDRLISTVANLGGISFGSGPNVTAEAG